MPAEGVLHLPLLPVRSDPLDDGKGPVRRDHHGICREHWRELLEDLLASLAVTMQKEHELLRSSRFRSFDLIVEGKGTVLNETPGHLHLFAHDQAKAR